MKNLINTVKESGKVRTTYRIKFHKMKTCDLHDSPEADTNELQKTEQEDQNSTHEAEDGSNK
jgi:hypothetical protein